MTRCEQFFSLLEWIVQRKDFEDFWPLGLESSCPKYIPQLVIDIEELRTKGELTNPPDYPTSNMTLIFALIYGMRELGWDSSKCADFLDGIFDVTQSDKYGSIFNEDGKNLIWSPEEIEKYYEDGLNAVEMGIAIDDINDLSGSVLALAEAEYFFNHRIATEKHGPYVSSDGNIYVARSFKNLYPSNLWPQLKDIDLPNNECHIIMKLKPTEIRFDVLSNPVASYKSKEDVVGVSLYQKEKVWKIENTNDIKSLIRNIHKGIAQIYKDISNMSKEEKCEYMTRILYFGCRSNITDWEGKSESAIIAGRRRNIRYPVPRIGDERLKYYDLTRSFS